MSELPTHVETLAKKAADAPTAAEAMHFAQAALNAANAANVLSDLDKRSK